MSVRIDESDFIEAPQGVNSLIFGDEKQQARFELGVSMCIYKWDALEVAVTNQWGGPDSADKRDWITAIVVELFQERVVDLVSIEEVLLNAMEDEFDVSVEDDSALPVAAQVFQIYRQCLLQDYDNVQLMYLQWQEKQLKREQERAKYVVESSGEEDDGEDAAPQLVETTRPEPTGPIIDEDGFQVVQRKGRRH